MLIDIRSLTGQPGALTELDLQISQEAFGVKREDLSLSSPVTFTGTLRHTEHGILILSGQAKASYTGICARCLKSVSRDLDTQVRESFEPTGLLPDNGEMQPGDTYGYAGLEIDIGQAIRDNLIPLLPVRIICQDDCAGLCPICGTDRNEDPCDCLQTGKGRPSPFDSLKQLL